MQKKYYIFNSIIAGIYVLFVLLNSVITNGEYSEIENRYLQKKPGFSLSGIIDRTYMNELENYTNDHIIFRDFFVKSKAFFQRFTGKKENNGVYYADDGYLIEKPHNYDYNLIDENINSIINLSETNRYKVDVCIIPQAFEIHSDKLPTGVYNDSVKMATELIKENLAMSNISYADCTGILKSHKDEYIFYRTDHHQTSLGSYYTYVAMSDILGYTPINLTEFKSDIVSSDFLGTTYSKGLVNDKKDEIHVYKTDIANNVIVDIVSESKVSNSLYFDEHLGKKDKYSYFLDGNHGLTIIKNGVQNGKSLAIFKDSYAHSIVPFLVNHFETIHLIDMRYFNEDPMKYLYQNNIEQVLLLYGTSTFMSDTSISKIGDYAKNSPYAKSGLVEKCAKVDDEYFSDAVFLGDSLTMGFESYSGFDNANFVCRTSMSVGGVFITEHDGSNLIQKVKALNPKKIYVLLGVNENLVSNNKDNVIKKYSKVIDELKANNPQAIIYVQSILPVTKQKEISGRIKNNVVYDYNESLKKLSEEKYVYYIDLYNAVTDSQGYLRSDITVDGVHLGKQGCKLWADYLRTHAVEFENTNYDSKDTIPAMSFQTGKYNLEEICNRIKKEAVFEGDIESASPKNLLKTHRIEQGMVKNAVGLVGGGAFAEEIFLLELNSVQDSEEIKKILNDYIKIRIGNFESYIPKEVPKLKNAIIYSDKEFVALVISSDNKNVMDILKNINRLYIND